MALAAIYLHTLANNNIGGRYCTRLTTPHWSRRSKVGRAAPASECLCRAALWGYIIGIVVILFYFVLSIKRMQRWLLGLPLRLEQSSYDGGGGPPGQMPAKQHTMVLTYLPTQSAKRVSDACLRR